MVNRLRIALKTNSLGLAAIVLIFLGAALCSVLQSQEKPPASAPTYDSALFQALEYRYIGPFRGGRSTAVSGVRSEQHTFYMGSTGGGVWKTTDSGETWLPVSDGQIKSGSVGAIAVADSDSNVVYVGMGSACIRGNVSPGDGVYKSTDAGKTWKHIGLRDAGQIARIHIHPTHPELVYIAVQGHAFGSNAERGVFRSEDGGGTWEKVHFVSENAGASDLAMDVNNPRILYAGFWQVVRKPWGLVSGGKDSGLYKTTDGGDTWSKLTEGLPQGITGKTMVAVSPANADHVWAHIEAEEGGVFRSDDGGKSFKRINSERKLRQRAWYYTHIYADPADENTVYVQNTSFYKSVDGGKTYERIRVPHGDTHHLWLNPKEPQIMIQGDDGGASVTHNGGKTWSTQANQPTAEFYRVTTDNQFPYRVLGAQQDNSTMSIPSRTTEFGITSRHWYDVGGGESGHIAADPRNPNIVYAGSYGGEITRYDHATRQVRNILSYPQNALGQAARDLRYRFQWNAPIRISTHDPTILYHASNVVHKSTNEGQSWELISPDLSRNDKSKQNYSGGPITQDNTGVEVYGTVFALEESPKQKGLLWAGSDDGLVHISRDDGGKWENVTPKDMPEWGQVNMIEPSPHNPGRAFMAVTKYKFDDFKSYIFRTDDFGKNWSLLTTGANGIPSNHFTRVVREDPDRRGLLYAGTEFGMYVSFNDGLSWQSLQLNLPVTPIADLQVKEKDLVVATQGRSFWILDDLTPLHQISDEMARAKAYLYSPRDTYRMEGGRVDRPGIGMNPPNGAMIFYYFFGKPKGEVTLEILDSTGNPLRYFSSKEAPREPPSELDEFLGATGGDKQVSANSGMNRFVWDLRSPEVEVTKGTIQPGATRGPKVVPGTYQVRLKADEWSQTRSFRVKKDPRLTTTQEDFQKQFDLAVQIREQITEIHKAVSRIRDVKKQVEELADRVRKAGHGKEVGEAAMKLNESLAAIEEKLIQTKWESSGDTLNFPGKLDSQFVSLNGIVTGADVKPTDGSYQRFDELKTKLGAHLGHLQEILTTGLTALNDMVRRKGIPAVVVPTK